MERIDPRQLLIDITGILDDIDIPYLVTGGMAVFVWGRPRFTADVDIVIELDHLKGMLLEKALRVFSEKGYIDKTMIDEAIRDNGEFNFIDGETGVKVDFRDYLRVWAARLNVSAILAPFLNAET